DYYCCSYAGDYTVLF
nr:immunoglobulin light chain junction region [Macaca mulatta]MOV96194.1 immunoglobulin light chain junction region [Macaca mulatta]MOV97020.1 immunoglobulin light chain junction region [Macaca mulatta]